MWHTYNASGRAAIQDANVPGQLDHLLGNAYQYIVTHS